MFDWIVKKLKKVPLAWPGSTFSAANWYVIATVAAAANASRATFSTTAWRRPRRR
jgi:hypothetical protein